MGTNDHTRRVVDIVNVCRLLLGIVSGDMHDLSIYEILSILNILQYLFFIH